MQRREASDAEVGYLAHDDPLTGLVNRSLFNGRRAGALHPSKNTQVTVLVIDLHRFKDVNKALGHATGDALHRAVAERLQGSRRSMDLAGPMVGDAFAVPQTHLKHPEEAAKQAEGLITVPAQPYDLDSHEMRCTATIAIGSLDAKIGDDRPRLADAALYQAKCDGRCTFRLCESGMNEALHARRIFEQELRRAIEASGLPPDRLELEITERFFMNDTVGILTDLHRLRELGISIALDDFGTDYSSLAYLRRFPFDKLKIDRSFVTDLEIDPKLSEFVRTIISLGRTLTQSTTAEGIETSQKAAALIHQGCDLGLGFFLGRPASAKDLRYPHARMDKAAT